MKTTYETRCERCGNIHEWFFRECITSEEITEGRKQIVELFFHKMQHGCYNRCEFCDSMTHQKILMHREINDNLTPPKNQR